MPPRPPDNPSTEGEEFRRARRIADELRANVLHPNVTACRVARILAQLDLEGQGLPGRERRDPPPPFLSVWEGLGPDDDWPEP